MDWIIFLLVGIVVGLIANFIHPSYNKWGLFGDLFLGIVGVFFGEWLAGLLGISIVSVISSIIAGVIGAIILLVIWGFIKSALFKPKSSNRVEPISSQSQQAERNDDEL